MIFRRLKDTNAALQKANDELEKMVAERTADIRKANEMLRQEIEERKHAQLETKNDNASSKEYIQISIKDSGIGLKKENLTKIFQPFQQVENSSSRHFQGTGLGLSLAKSLVELNGGKIWAESDGEDLGSVFSFSLPV